MSVGVFAPAIRGLPEHLRKLRFANDFIDFVVPFGGGDVHLKFGIDPHKRFPIDVLSDALAFGAMLAEDGARLEGRLNPLRRRSPTSD